MPGRWQDELGPGEWMPAHPFQPEMVPRSPNRCSRVCKMPRPHLEHVSHLAGVVLPGYRGAQSREQRLERTGPGPDPRNGRSGGPGEDRACMGRDGDLRPSVPARTLNPLPRKRPSVPDPEPMIPVWVPRHPLSSAADRWMGWFLHMGPDPGSRFMDQRRQKALPGPGPVHRMPGTGRGPTRSGGCRTCPGFVQKQKTSRHGSQDQRQDPIVDAPGCFTEWGGARAGFRRGFHRGHLHDARLENRRIRMVRCPRRSSATRKRPGKMIQCPETR